MPLSEHVYYVAKTFKIAEWVEQRICVNFFFCLKLEHSSEKLFRWYRRLQLWAPVTGSFIKTMPPLMYHVPWRVLWQNIKSPRWLSAPYSWDLAPCNFWLFPKLKSPLKGKRFQTVNEIQENTLGQLMVLGELCEVPRCLLWRHHCPMYNVSCILYLLQ